MMGLNSAFSSLSMNEQNSPEKKLEKNGSSISLPNLTSGEKLNSSNSLVSRRLQYSDPLDDVEAGDQPVDFSKKYSENKREEIPTSSKQSLVYNTSYTIYTETDLDQPTDYSLRYAEDDSDVDETKNQLTKTEFIPDTIKTYCTEDTPYETPFNYSTSTSMSDLRILDDNKSEKLGEINSESEVVHEKETVPVHKSAFSSGIMSPEKPVNYCDEGTPGYFSRVDSCGSLNNLPIAESPKQELKPDETIVKADGKPKVNKFTSEVKAVKFEEVVNYAEETPLMFSRSSSLASLDSIEQHSIHDDRSSIVSTFSRLTSGVISPSELPDSPTQTVPPSPKQVSTLEEAAKKFGIDENQTNSKENEPKLTMVNDSVRNYCTEDTPAILSQSGSHSDLSVLSLQDMENGENYFSDEDSSDDDQLLAECIRFGMDAISSTSNFNRTETHKSNNDKSGDIQNYLGRTNSQTHSEAAKSEVDLNISLESNNGSDVESECSSVSASSDDESIASEEQALLEECILAGMPTKSAPSKSKSATSASTSSHETTKLTQMEKSLLQECILEGMKSIGTRKKHQEHNNELTLLKQCILSGMPKSNSNRTVRRRENDDSERLLLQQCILAGMPKSRPPSNMSRSSVSKSFSRSGKPREPKRVEQIPEHSCCIHCPRNNGNVAKSSEQSSVTNRKKSRSDRIVVSRDSRERNLVYVTSQMLAYKKELVDRTQDEWI